MKDRLLPNGMRSRNAVEGYLPGAGLGDSITSKTTKEYYITKRSDWASELSVATAPVPGAKRMGLPVPARGRRESPRSSARRGRPPFALFLNLQLKEILDSHCFQSRTEHRWKSHQTSLLIDKCRMD